MYLTRLDREKDLEREVKCIHLKIGSRTYRFTETPEGKLEINKYDESTGSGQLEINPRVSNVVEIK